MFKFLADVYHTVQDLKSSAGGSAHRSSPRIQKLAGQRLREGDPIAASLLGQIERKKPE
jgi:hypothetical protein